MDQERCRICFESDNSEDLIAPCNCSGTQRMVHRECQMKWIRQKGLMKCEVCQAEYLWNRTGIPYTNRILCKKIVNITIFHIIIYALFYATAGNMVRILLGPFSKRSYIITQNETWDIILVGVISIHICLFFIFLFALMVNADGFYSPSSLGWHRRITFLALFVYTLIGPYIISYKTIIKNCNTRNFLDNHELVSLELV
jgi:hypothetical protein